jgi:hypothetical protein
MVLINEKKYACATCIKGHRVSGCTHTERPLFEVKKKGRPATQCHFCRDKRKGGTTSGSVHTKVCLKVMVLLAGRGCARMLRKGQAAGNRQPVTGRLVARGARLPSFTA